MGGIDTEPLATQAELFVTQLPATESVYLTVRGDWQPMTATLPSQATKLCQ
jgi:hypothetical protein